MQWNSTGPNLDSAALLRAAPPPPLTLDDERRLGWAIINERCPIARQSLFERSMHLADLAAVKFAGRGLGSAELHDAAVAGLWAAVDSFDPAHGRRFSTHATWCIRHAIRCAAIRRFGTVYPRFAVRPQ